MPGLAISVGGRTIQTTLRIDFAIPLSDQPPKLFEGQFNGMPTLADGALMVVRSAWYLEIAKANGATWNLGTALSVPLRSTQLDTLLPELFAGAVW
jgi:hypothetical protein